MLPFDVPRPAMWVGLAVLLLALCALAYFAMSPQVHADESNLHTRSLAPMLLSDAWSGTLRALCPRSNLHRRAARRRHRQRST